MKKQVVKICIIHYNTPQLLNYVLMSVKMHTPNSEIFVFDNSDKYPFHNTFENVTVIDNTKGQYINWQDFLNRYPDRLKSPGKINGHGSAKHAYSIEKCMELINDNFILLDSDVLLKKDITPLFDNKFITIGEVFTQPYSTIQRILPFINFINVNECKKRGIHYFDENMMHGLMVSPLSDKYDTGASFFYKVKDLNIKHIKCNEYVEHYGSGSWIKDLPEWRKHNYTLGEWLRVHSEYWYGKKERIAVYTCITDGYDNLIEPDKHYDGVDFICFTDEPEQLTSDIWDIRPLPDGLSDLTKVKQQRHMKILPHRYLSDYEISIWIDGSIKVTGDIVDWSDKTLDDKHSVYIPQHPTRSCVYVEGAVCKSIGKDAADVIDTQMERYRNDGYPQNNGLVQSNIILRRHNDVDCIALMESWWTELYNGSRRDQLSFNYALWKTGVNVFTALDKCTCQSEWFKWNPYHHNKQPRNEQENVVKQETKHKPKHPVKIYLRKRNF